MLPGDPNVDAHPALYVIVTINLSPRVFVRGKRSAEAEMHDPRVVAAMQRSSASGSGVSTWRAAACRLDDCDGMHLANAIIHLVDCVRRQLRSCTLP